MARKSKPEENKEKSEVSEEPETGDAGSEQAPERADSQETGSGTVAADDDSAAGAPAEDSKSEGAPAAPVVAAEPGRQGPGVMALMLAGLAAGAIGFGAAYLVPSPPDPELSEAVEAGVQRIETLSAELSELRETMPEPVEPDLSGVEAALTDLAARLDEMDGELAALRQDLDAGTADLAARIAALESADPSGMPEAAEEQIVAFRERLEEITAEAEGRLESAVAQAAELEAAAATRAEELEQATAEAAAAAEAEAAEIEAAARREAALAELNAAMESGQAFSSALDALGEAPKALTAVAEDGVPTLASLQRSFPDAARDALSAAVTVPEDASATERFTAFLKRRTNARSLTPKEGDGPDAVLSRAEAALTGGDLGGALAELEALPGASRTAMQEWLDRATTREAAIRAVEGLSATN